MRRRRPLLTRGEAAIKWLEEWCATPAGKPVQLTPAERATIYATFDAGAREPIDGRLAAFLALLTLAGPSELHLEALEIRTDFFSVWAAAGTELRGYLQRRGRSIECRERGTAWTAAA